MDGPQLFQAKNMVTAHGWIGILRQHSEVLEDWKIELGVTQSAIELNENSELIPLKLNAKIAEEFGEYRTTLDVVIGKALKLHEMQLENSIAEKEEFLAEVEKYVASCVEELEQVISADNEVVTAYNQLSETAKQFVSLRWVQDLQEHEEEMDVARFMNLMKEGSNVYKSIF